MKSWTPIRPTRAKFPTKSQITDRGFAVIGKSRYYTQNEFDRSVINEGYFLVSRQGLRLDVLMSELRELFPQATIRAEYGKPLIKGFQASALIRYR